MRQRIVISAVVIVLILSLVAGVGHFGLGWWQPEHATITESGKGYDSPSEPATLPEVLVTAHQALDEIEHNVDDYCGVIVKKERVGTSLITTVMFAKIREKPFSVYLNFLDRSDNQAAKGREVIFAQGQNNDKLMVHTPGIQDATVGTLSLDPKGFLATQGERYPITEIGLANLCRQLIKRGESAGDPSRVQVNRYLHARINTRTCSLLEITYPVQEPKTWGYLAAGVPRRRMEIPHPRGGLRVAAGPRKVAPACGGIYLSRPETQ